MSDNMHDDALMQAIQQGREAAFRLLVQRWENQVRAFLVHMLSSVEEAEDLTQDTFVKVYHQADKYSPEGKFQSWLFRIAGNLARSKLRRRKVISWIRFDPDYHDHADDRANPETEYHKKNDALRVKQAIAQLPERQRQALVLHRFQGLKYREIAEAMDATVPAVESLIQRAMRQLGDALKEKAGES
ncbi:MAG: RNA polymerase sigma factor [bacterium]|nr:RNA polymerase sigma factor [bacterium]